jgi:hypothetical protein
MPGMKKKSTGWEKYKAGMDRMASKTAKRPAPKRAGAEGPKKRMPRKAK